MASFLEHVACDGQINMARIGYSPLPPNLSQEMMNAEARLTGKPAKQLNAGNCNNPTYQGGLGAGANSPVDPFAKLGGVDKLTKGGTGGPAAGAQAHASSSSAVPIAGSVTTPPSANQELTNGGTTAWRSAEPALYDGGRLGGFGAWAALALFVAIVAPLVIRGVPGRIRRWLSSVRPRQ
jgi:phosphate transport system substrate-binding protein